MTAAAKPNFGAELWVGPTGSMVKLGELISTDPPELVRGVADATSHDSAGGATEVIPEGTYTVGPLSGKFYHIGNSTTDAAMFTAVTTGAKQDWKIVDHAASGNELASGSGYVTRYKVDELTLNGAQVAGITITPTGPMVSA